MEYKEANYKAALEPHVVIPEIKENAVPKKEITDYNTFIFRYNEVSEAFFANAKEINEENVSTVESITAAFVDLQEKVPHEFFANPDFSTLINESEFIPIAFTIISNPGNEIFRGIATNLLHFISVVSKASENFSLAIFTKDYLSIITNPDIVTNYTEEQIVYGISAVTCIIKKCDVSVLMSLRDQGFINYLISLIQKEALDSSKEELDYVVANALANYFDRVFQTGDESFIELVIEFFRTFNVLNLKAKTMAIYLVYNLLTQNVPAIGKPVLTIKNMVSIRMMNNSVFIIEILFAIGGIGNEAATVATKLATYLFSKNAISPKKYYLLALNIPWALLINKITGNDDLSEAIIQLIITVLNIDSREVDPIFMPSSSFIDMISATKCLQTIYKRYDRFNYKSKVASMHLFHLIMVRCQPKDFYDVIGQGLINTAFEQLDSDDFGIRMLSLDGLLCFVQRITACEEAFSRVVEIADELNAFEILEEFEEGELGEKAHALLEILSPED